MAKRNPEGVYQKIYNAASPFRSTMRRFSHLPPASIAVTSDQRQLSQKTKSPVSINSPQTVPVHSLHQSKMIPIEFDPQNAPLKENNTSDSEIRVVRSHKLVKSVSRKQEAARPEKPIPVSANEAAAPNHVAFGKEKSDENDDPEHENEFTAYIDKVKSRFQ